MLGNPRVKALFGSAYHSLVNHELLEVFMYGRHTSGGKSFWFSQTGQAVEPFPADESMAGEKARTMLP
jgi:hypothetical protein